MPATVEAQFDALVHEPFAHHPLAHAGLVQQVDRVLLEHAGAYRRLDVLAAARLEHDRVDALQMQEVGKQQSRGARPDYADLCAHLVLPATFDDQPRLPLGRRDLPANAAAQFVSIAFFIR